MLPDFHTDTTLSKLRRPFLYEESAPIQFGLCGRVSGKNVPEQIKVVPVPRGSNGVMFSDCVRGECHCSMASVHPAATGG